jgi:hypothetical protein
MVSIASGYIGQFLRDVSTVREAGACAKTSSYDDDATYARRSYYDEMTDKIRRLTLSWQRSGHESHD